jgi:hypothetical protein
MRLSTIALIVLAGFLFITYALLSWLTIPNITGFSLSFKGGTSPQLWSLLFWFIPITILGALVVALKPTPVFAGVTIAAAILSLVGQAAYFLTVREVGLIGFDVGYWLTAIGLLGVLALVIIERRRTA